MNAEQIEKLMDLSGQTAQEYLQSQVFGCWFQIAVCGALIVIGLLSLPLAVWLMRRGERCGGELDVIGFVIGLFGLVVPFIAAGAMAGGAYDLYQIDHFPKAYIASHIVRR